MNDAPPIPAFAFHAVQPTAAEAELATAVEAQIERSLQRLVEAWHSADADTRDEQLAKAHADWLGCGAVARIAMSNPAALLESRFVGARELASQGLVQAAVDAGDSRRASLVSDAANRCANGQQVAIFASSADTAEQLARDIAASGVAAATFTSETRSPQTVHQFNEGAIQLLVMTDAGMRGVGLPAAGAIIHYDLPWALTQAMQRNGRGLRMDSVHERVEIAFYGRTGTYEARLAEALCDPEALLAALDSSDVPREIALGRLLLGKD
jgi:superfamily II DNA or RNA helicase